MEEAVKYIEDDRAEQPALAMLVALGEISGNITQMQRAIDTSLAITEGKVTELTPVPIPEALAAAYQASGNLEKAMYYYKLALDGIGTFVIRPKTDAIVLNACLVMAQTDKQEALRIAIDYSPFFSDTQLNIAVGPCRSLLVQQCETWSKELGFASLSAAQEEQVMTIHDFSLPTLVLNIPPSNRDFEEKTDKKQKTDRQPATVGNKSCGSCNIM
jgi:hypothetical protein